MHKTPYRHFLLPLLLLAVLAACTDGDGPLMRQQLERLEKMNQADSVMTNDTLAERLVKYFDRHGNPNERMRAHYILGRTYADMGEAPAALEAYLEAASCADTTAADFDWAKLSRVFGQMSSIYYQQNLMDRYLENLDRSVYYAWRAQDTLQAIRESILKVAAYNRLKQYDKVVTTFDELFNLLQQTYGNETAAKYVILPLNALIERGQLDRAGQFINMAESKSGYFDSIGNIEKGRENYYYYKGCYYMARQQYDSAIYFFKKELLTGADVMNQNMASRGLSLAYSHANNPDSASKYALYSYEMMDSVYTQMATAESERITSVYDYGRHQRQVLQERAKISLKNLQIAVLLAVVAIVLLLSGILLYSWKRKKDLVAHKYKKVVKELEIAKAEKKQAEMELQHTYTLKTELLALRGQVASFTQSEERDAKNDRNTSLDQLKKEYDQIIDAKERLIECLKDKIEKLQKEIADSKYSAKIIKAQSGFFVETFHLDSGKLLTEREWRSLNGQLKEKLPGFYDFLQETGYGLSSNKYRICVLLRLGLSSKIVSYTLGVSSSDISKLSTKILQECFNEKGSGRELTRKLASIG